MSVPSRPYQGYPYVNPIATEAPSLTPEQVAAMARWANLPKTFGGGNKDGRFIRPVTSEKKTESIEEVEIEEEDRPVVYIDTPEATCSGVSQRNESMKNDEAPPIVYIDIQEEHWSGVSQNRDDDQMNQPSFVQETIYYDQFKDRRIDGATVAQSSGESSGLRPAPPTSLRVPSAGSSGYNSIETQPPFLSKESQIYGRLPSPDDGFRLSPLPVEDFPPPPPAYHEIDPRYQAPASNPGNPGGNQPPRTQVITAGPSTSQNPNSKYIVCQFCHHPVHTLVTETGLFTHALSCVCLISCCTRRNHYCPNCNHRVAYEIPILGVDTTYTTNS